MQQASTTWTILLSLMASAALLGAPAPARAQETADQRLDRMEKELARQRAEIADLRRQQAAEPGVVTPTGAMAGFSMGYRDGFFLRGEADGMPFEIRPRVRMQLDYRGFAAPTSMNDQFVLRRTRVGFEGRVGDFYFDLEADPPRSGVPLGDFFFQWQRYEELKIRGGHYKTPFSIEDGLTSDLYTDFVERAMFVGSGWALAPDFRPGAEVFGRLAGGALGYWISAQNQPDSSSVNNGDPLVCARVATEIGGLSLGTSGIWDREGAKGTRSLEGRTPGQFTFFTPIAVHGWTQRYEADLAYYGGPFWFQSEYGWARQQRDGILANGGDGDSLVEQGFYATVGWKIWGPPGFSKEKSKADPGSPHGAPFRDWQLFSMDIERVKNGRNVGLEVLARVEWMGASGQHAGGPETTATAARFIAGNGAKAVTTGINFDPIENVRLMIDWVHLRFDHRDRAERGGSRQADEFLIRWQMEF